MSLSLSIQTISLSTSPIALSILIQSHIFSGGYNFLFAAILLTGGHSKIRPGWAAQLYVPSTNQSCNLPELPTYRYYHSQIGLRACGGGPNGLNSKSDTSCDTWNPETGSWEKQDVSLLGCRDDISWTTSSGTYLIGTPGCGTGAYGYIDNEKTSDLLKPNGTVIPGFNSSFDIK